MSEKQSYLDLTASEALFAKAAARDENAINELAGILQCAELRYLSEWADDVRSAWEKGLDSVLAPMDGGKLNNAECELLKAMLDLRFDTPAFRDRYALLVKSLFPDYSNPSGLADELGCRNSGISLAQVAASIIMFPYLKEGAVCYDMAFGKGIITGIDDLNNEVTVLMNRKRTLRFGEVFSHFFVVKKESKLMEILNGTFEGKFIGENDFKEAMKLSVAGVKPFSMQIIKKILVPGCMTEGTYSALSMGRTLVGQLKKADSAVEKKLEEKIEAPAESIRWDTSRSVAELAGRMKEASSLALDNPDLAKVKSVLENAIQRVDQAENFATSIAFLKKIGSYDDMLFETLGNCSSDVVVWKDTALFVEISDKMLGKLVPFWFQVTRQVMGSRYLVDCTMKMPYRLWTYTEKLLATISGEKNMLADTVFSIFATGKVNAEMFFWLWKAPKSELRTKYLSDSYLLFKTLHQEVRGSYLKSQRTLHKLLVDDESFQREIMDFGNEEAIKALVHCVKHLPLLDAGERQALQVKIVRCYPSALHIVEERRTNLRRSFGKITSVRSFEVAKRELEDLVNVQIPENVAAIEHARSLGDLRENSEFKFAKERQGLLARRRSELEDNLAETQTTTFRDVQITNVVVPGSVVTIEYENGTTETFTILGRFDSYPEQKMISYETPLGKTLVNSKIGDEIEMPAGDVATIKKVEKLSEELLDWLNAVPEKN